MTPKEKAEELMEQYNYLCRECKSDWNAKECAIFAVDKIMENNRHYVDGLKFIDASDYWIEVKKEIGEL
jgi:hypothetical protein